jgi:hypothetical protein
MLSCLSLQMNIPAALSGIAHSDDAVGCCATNAVQLWLGFGRGFCLRASYVLAFSEIKKFPLSLLLCSILIPSWLPNWIVSQPFSGLTGEEWLQQRKLHF